MKPRDKIDKSLEKRRKSTTTKGCSLWRAWGIPLKVKYGGLDDLYDWEKEHFLKGIRLRKWDENGNFLNTITESNESEFQKKVDDKILQHQVNDYVDDLENPPIKDLAIDIPPNPFDGLDADDELFQSDELNFKQNQRLRRYLVAKGYKDFNQFWEKEAKKVVWDLQREALVKQHKGGEVVKWLDEWFKKNENMIINRCLGK